MGLPPALYAAKLAPMTIHQSNGVVPVAMTRSGLLDEVGDDNVFGNLDDSLDRARSHLGLPPHAHLAGATPTVARETGEHPVVRG